MAGTMLLIQAAVAAVLTAGSSSLSPGADESKLRKDLQLLSQRRVFFGHQSVGVNLLDGIRALASQQHVAIQVAEPQATGIAPGSIGHAFVGRNLDPLSKLRDFEQAFASGTAAGADLAMVKFCYVDVTADTDANALFSEYQAAMARLRAAYPGTTIVHVTVPLTTIQGGWKAIVKRLIGRAPGRFADNVRREEFNTLIRTAYQGREPLFDLARSESTHPDGRLETAEWGGRTVPMLVPDLSDDYGHLNREGQLQAGRELIAVLASAPVRRQQAGGAATR
jgi:hypothetical protein